MSAYIDFRKLKERVGIVARPETPAFCHMFVVVVRSHLVGSTILSDHRARGLLFPTLVAPLLGVRLMQPSW